MYYVESIFLFEKIIVYQSLYKACLKKKKKLFRHKNSNPGNNNMSVAVVKNKSCFNVRIIYIFKSIFYPKIF